MATIKFENGPTITFEGNPTQQDIEEIANKLGLNQTQPEQTSFESGFGGSKYLGSSLGLLSEAKPLLQTNKQGQALTNLIQDRLTQGQLTPERANKLLQGLQITKENLNQIAPHGTTKQRTGAATEFASTVAAPFLPGAGTAISRIFGLGGGLGALGGISKGLEQNQSLSQIPLEAVKGSLKGIAVAGSLEGLGQLAFKGIPALLRKTSGQSKELMDINMNNPEFKLFGKNPEAKDALVNAQQVYQEGRKNLSSFYKVRGQELSDQFSGQRVGFNEKEVKLLEKVAEDYGLQSLPQNTKSFSLKEGLGLLKELNQKNPKILTSDAERLITIKKLTSGLLRKSFGETSPVGEFLNEYGQRKAVLDASNSIIKVHLSKNPVSQVNNINRLNRTFSGNTGEEFINALKGLEQATGKNVLGKVAAVQSKKILPKGVPGLVENIIQKAGLALTSPRITLGETKLIYGIENLLKKSGLNNFVRILASKEAGKL